MKKNYSISLIRFISMLLVISCHTCEWIGFTLGESDKLGIIGNYCAVGVQVFLLISGYLYGSRKGLFEQRNRWDFVFNSWWKILKDYYIYTILVIFPVYYFLSPGTINTTSVWGVITCSNVIGGVQHLWYIPYILLAYLITPALYDYKQYFIGKINKGLTWVILSLCILIVSVEIVCIAYSSYFIAAWINCFIVGFFLPDIIEKLSEREKLCLVMGTVVVSIVLNYIKLTVRYEYLPIYTNGIKNILCNYFINYSRVVFALAIFFLLLFVTKKINWNNSLGRFLEMSDKYSYDVYIVHMIYVKGILSVLDITGNYILNVCLMLVLTVLSAVILHFISNYFRRLRSNEKTQLLH